MPATVFGGGGPAAAARGGGPGKVPTGAVFRSFTSKRARFRSSATRFAGPLRFAGRANVHSTPREMQLRQGTTSPHLTLRLEQASHARPRRRCRTAWSCASCWSGVWRPEGPDGAVMGGRRGDDGEVAAA